MSDNDEDKITRAQIIALSVPIIVISILFAPLVLCTLVGSKSTKHFTGPDKDVGTVILIFWFVTGLIATAAYWVAVLTVLLGGAIGAG